MVDIFCRVHSEIYPEKKPEMQGIYWKKVMGSNDRLVEIYRRKAKEEKIRNI